jgi:hypothetical protein
MFTKSTPSSKEIIELLSRLKAETPDYPAHILAARKNSFLNHAATLKIQGKGQGGEGGQQGGSGGSGASGTALGGSTTVQGIILQAIIGLGIVATMLIGMLTGNYLFRDQVSDRLEEDIVVVIESSAPTILPASGTSETPTEDVPGVATPEVTATATESNTTVENLNDDPAFINDLLDVIKDNPGLHLGQATGTPAAPGQGNPGNINQPNKPGKPDKPDKPDRPDRPDTGR